MWATGCTDLFQVRHINREFPPHDTLGSVMQILVDIGFEDATRQCPLPSMGGFCTANQQYVQSVVHNAEERHVCKNQGI